MENFAMRLFVAKNSDNYQNVLFEGNFITDMICKLHNEHVLYFYMCAHRTHNI